MNINRVKDLLYMALMELERLEERPAPANQIPIEKVIRKAKMRLYDAYVKGIIDKDTLERELRKLNQEPPTLY